MRLSAHRRRGGRAWAWLLAGLLVGGAAGAGTVYVLKRGKAGLPGGPRLGEAKELALVPGDAVGFIHFRARDVWHSPHFAEFRKIVERAGPEALAALDENFVPAPSSLDRLTLVLMNNPEAPKPPAVGFDGRPVKRLIDGPAKVEPVGILSFTAAFDADKVRSSLLPNAAAKKAGGRDYWVDAARGLAAYFPSDTVLVVGTPVGVASFVGKQTGDGSPSAGPLARAAAHAGKGSRHFVAAVNLRYFTINLEALKDELGELLDDPGVGAGELIQLAKDAEALLKADALGVGFALGDDESKFDLRAYFKDDASAVEGEKAVRSVAAFARKKLEKPRKQLEQAIKGPPGQTKPFPIDMLPQSAGALLGLGLLNTVDGYLANPPLERDGSELVATFDGTSVTGMYAGATAVGVAMLLPAVQKVREAATRMQSSNNLKQIGIAMHAYHDTHNHLPPPAMAVPGNPKGGGLSWRVHLLPHLEEDALYKQFKLNEPWDSPNNMPLVARMPKVYMSPNAPPEPGKTYYKVFVGRGATFEPGSKFRMTDITDGTSNTIMTVEGGDAVVWTKPDDIPFTGNVTPMSLALNGNPRIQVGLVDGSVRTIDLSRIRPQTLNGLITRNGGEALGNDW